MFAQKTRLLVVAASLLLSVNAHAGFVETDWQTVGDKKATLHQETGLEWLDLTVTGGKTINEVRAMLNTSLVGWRMPTYDEIKQLAASMFPTMQGPEYHYGAISGAYANEFKMFGSNIANHYYGIFERDNRTYGMSLYSTTSTPPNTLSSGELYYGYSLSSAGGGYRGGSSDLDVYRVYEGVYLVSDGGVTLSSLNNPTLNINNPNAPINSLPPVSDVYAPAVGSLAFMLFALGIRRYVKRS